ALRCLKSCQVNAIVSKLSSDLRLTRSVGAQNVGDILEKMRHDGLVVNSKGHWEITDSGEKTAKDVPPEAARELLAGRSVIRNRLEALIGVRFHDSQFEKIWSTLLDFLSELFHSNGLAIMRAINEFIAPSDEKTDGFSDLSTLLLKGAHSIGLCAGD